MGGKALYTEPHRYRSWAAVAQTTPGAVLGLPVSQMCRTSQRQTTKRAGSSIRRGAAGILPPAEQMVTPSESKIEQQNA